MRHASLSAAAAVLAATLVAGGVAWATIPGPGGVVSGCYRVSEDDQKGQVRVVADATSCKNNEASISWNQVGPQGPKGEKGDQGVQGQSGSNGTDGRDGTNGTNGANGSDGVSVTSSVEPAGANCATGGSRFTAANGVTYACNGGGPVVKTIAGRVASDGTVMLGTGFAVGHVGNGGYTISFPAGTWSECPPVVTFTPRSGLSGPLTIPGLNTSVCGSDGSGQVNVYFWSIGGVSFGTDTQFDFIAAQP